MKTMKLYFLGIILLTSFYPAIGQIDRNYRENHKKAFVASTISECQSSLKFCNEVLKLVPNHPTVNYLGARLNAILGNEELAITQLRKATEAGYTTKLPYHNTHQLNDTAFNKLRSEIEFEEIIKALEKAEKPIHNSQIAFNITDKKLGTEGITYDPVEKMFYLGSMYKQKIVKVDHHGNSIDFTQEGQDGLNIVLGMHVDPVRRILWTCSENNEMTGIYKYNLSTKELIKKYLLPFDAETSFNDLVIHPNGNVYISNARSGKIYVISPSADKLELFLQTESIVSPNGITLSDDGKVIYLADSEIGIFKIDIKTKSYSLLQHEAKYNSAGIDGLYFMNNSLYAVQIVFNTISRFSLNKDATNIEKCEIIERYTPGLISPTTGVFVDDLFYYITDDGGEGKNPQGIIVMKASVK